MHARRAEHAVEHELRRDTAGDAHSARHRRVARARRRAVRLERRRARLGRAVRPLDHELVLQHHQVALAGRVRHQRLELRAERVEEVARARRERRGAEEPDPAQARDDARGLCLRGELAELLDAGDKGAVVKGSVVSRQIYMRDVRLSGVSSAGGLLGSLGPGEPGNEPLFLGGIEVAEVDERLDKLGESLVPERSAHNGLGLGDVVELAEGRRVAVGVRDECESRGDVIGLGVSHKLGSSDGDLLALGVVGGGVEKSEEDPA